MVEHLIAQFRPESLRIFSSDKAFPSIEWGEESKKPSFIYLFFLLMFWTLILKKKWFSQM